MKAGIFFTGTGPILILTSYNTLTDPNLVEKLDADPHELITFNFDKEVHKDA